VIISCVWQGYQLGELNLPQDKRNVYEFDTRIHLLAKGPGIRPGSMWSQVASNVDIAPSILALANVALPNSMDGKSVLKFLIDPASPHNMLPASVQAHLQAEKLTESPAQWRDTHYIKHNAVGAGNYPTPKPPNCGKRPQDPDDVHYVDQPDNNFIAIRHRGTANASNSASSPSNVFDNFSRVYREATSISTDFLYAEFNWNGAEQFDKKTGEFNSSLPSQRHLGTNNRDGGWRGGWSNNSQSSPGNVNFSEPFFFELY
jgi:hypothetical protein